MSDWVVTNRTEKQDSLFASLKFNSKYFFLCSFSVSLRKVDAFLISLLQPGKSFKFSKQLFCEALHAFNSDSSKHLIGHSLRHR